MWQTLGCLVILALSLPVEVPPPGTEHNPPSINQNVSAGGVNTQTGSFSLTRTDIQVRGPGLVFSHSYNSNDTRVGPLGPGWTHSYNIRLTAPGDSSADVVLVGPEGRSDRYTRSASSAFAPPPGVSTLLA